MEFSGDERDVWKSEKMETLHLAFGERERRSLKGERCSDNVLD